MNRLDFQQLANTRLQEARELLNVSLYDGAYYLAGYAVECALKSCISQQFSQHDFPPSPKLVRDMYSHQLEKLLGLSGVKTDLENAKKVNPQLDVNWTIVKDWSEQSRYEYGKQQHEARDMFEAIADPKDGILTWLKQRW